MPTDIASRIADRYLAAHPTIGTTTHDADGIPLRQPSILLRLQPDYGESDAALPRGFTAASANRVALRFLERQARNPPFHEAAKADEAMGQAYRSLVDLKLGFDSWHEIPPSAKGLYDRIGKAMSEVADARKETYQIRMMVQRGKYGSKSLSASIKSDAERLVLSLGKDLLAVVGLIHKLLRDWQYGGTGLSEDFGALTRSVHKGRLPHPDASALRAALAVVARATRGSEEESEIVAEFVYWSLLTADARDLAVKARGLILKKTLGLQAPSSTSEDIPLTGRQEEDAWNAGYEAASYHNTRGRPLRDSTEAFLWTVKHDRRVPDVKEGEPSFWEWVHAVGEGAQAYNKNEGEPFRMASAKTARAREDWAKLFRKGSYFNMFFSEKEIPDRVFIKHDKNGVEHSIPNGVVVEFMAQTGSGEMRNLENVVRKIDFANGDVNHFLDHLAGAIADQYSSVRLAEDTTAMGKEAGTMIVRQMTMVKVRTTGAKDIGEGQTETTGVMNIEFGDAEILPLRFKATLAGSTVVSFEPIQAISGAGAGKILAFYRGAFQMAVAGNGGRLAFNKESPDELFGQLVKLLKREGLDDEVALVKGLQPKVQKAWRNRDQE